MSHRWLIAGLFVISVLVASCSDTDDPGSSSADIEGTPVTIEAEPTLSLGVAAGDPDQEFGEVLTPLLFPDGRVAVPLDIAQEIRIFGPDGELLERLGGPGGGPGEFTGLAGVWLRGDTVEAYDWMLARVTRFLPGGEIETVQLVDPPAPNLMPIPRGAQPEDSWLLQAYGPVEFGTRDRLFVDRYRVDGTYAGRVAEVEGMLRRQAPGMTGPGPLSPLNKLAIHEGEAYVAETLTPEIEVFAPDGTLVRSIEWEPERSWSPDEALRVIEEIGLADASPEEARSMRVRFDYFAEQDDFVSVFAGFLVDELGFVWVQRFDPARHSTLFGGSGYGGWSPGGEWRVFSPEGVEVGSIVVPDDLEMVQITANAVLALRTGELGLQTVQVHALERR